MSVGKEVSKKSGFQRSNCEFPVSMLQHSSSDYDIPELAFPIMIFMKEVLAHQKTFEPRITSSKLIVEVSGIIWSTHIQFVHGKNKE